MKYQLISERDSGLSMRDQILVNRGIPVKDIESYLHTTDENINDFMLLDNCKDAAVALHDGLKQDLKIDIVVDADCDGYTSAALMYNYFTDIDKEKTQNNITYFMHSGKQHGLQDYPMDRVEKYSLNMVVCPDSSSNDYEQHKQLKEKGVQVIVMDHHEAPYVSEDAIIVNNQLCDYPNKHLSGVGITWQVCRCIDRDYGYNYAKNYYDLVALGNMADMMSMTDIETKHLILKGFKEQNLKNPFIYKMRVANEYSIGKTLTPMGAAFYIAPFINAMVRSGTETEKDLIFKSMLKNYAFLKIPSTKRGHAPGEEETIVDQAVRVAKNVKARQTKAQDKGLDLIKHKIKEDNLLEHKVLLFTLKPNEVDKNIAGLIANKIMADYQRPVCILQKNISKKDNGTEKVTYAGSARGCDLVGVNTFKDVCEESQLCEYAVGHQGAFGLCLEENNIKSFLDYTDKKYEDISSEPVYYVDAIYDKNNLPDSDIYEICSLGNIWGKDMDEPIIALKNIRITEDQVSVYEKKTNTIKIQLPNGLALMIFNAKDEDCDLFKYENKGYLLVNFVGTCNINEWNGIQTPQIFIKDYEVKNKMKHYF